MNKPPKEAATEFLIPVVRWSLGALLAAVAVLILCAASPDDSRQWVKDRARDALDFAMVLYLFGSWGLMAFVLRHQTMNIGSYWQNANAALVVFGGAILFAPVLFPALLAHFAVMWIFEKCGIETDVRTLVSIQDMHRLSVVSSEGVKTLHIDVDFLSSDHNRRRMPKQIEWKGELWRLSYFKYGSAIYLRESKGAERHKECVEIWRDDIKNVHDPD